MSYRYMRLLVMFDLPTATSADRKEYSKFRKELITSGFLMLQESIYCKLAPNSTASDSIIEHLRKNKPKSGLVQILKITEKQYSKIETIVGEKNSEVLDSDDRLIVL